MDISGKIIQILPLQSGKSAKGEWKKQDFILETDGTVQKKLCISSWGDKIPADSLKLNSKIKVFLDIESREYNGRWYTDVKAWKYELLDSPSSASKPDEDQWIQNEPESNVTDELPF